MNYDIFRIFVMDDDSMKRIYKTSNFTKSMGPVGILIALVFVGLFFYVSKALFNSNNALLGILVILLVFGAVTLGFVLLAYLCIDERNDTVTLTDNRIKFHLHRQTFPYSLKALDDEIRWKDIQNATFVYKERTTVLILTLISGEVKEFGIGHMDKRLKGAIESHFAPEVFLEEKDTEQVEDEDFVPGSPGTLAWSKKRAFLRLCFSALAGILGTILIALGKWPVFGFILVFYGLLFGFMFLYLYHLYNTMHIDPALSSKGRIVTILGGLLLVCILVTALIFVAEWYSAG